MRRGGFIACWVFAGCAAASPAWASPPADGLGFGPRAGALAGACTAVCGGADAAFYDPASVARADRLELLLGYSYTDMALTLDGRDAGVTSPHGILLGVALPADLGGGVRVALGVDAYLPDQSDAQILLLPATEPHFVLLGSDPNRVFVAPALSVRLRPWLSVGVGADLLADAAGNGTRFAVGAQGNQRVATAALDVSLPTRAAPTFGVDLEPRPGLRIGAAYFGEVDLGVRLDVLTHVNIPGIVVGDALIAVRATEFYTPETWRIGASYELAHRLLATAELDYLRWSAFKGGAPDVRVLLDLGVSPPLVNATLPPDNFHDTLEPHLGVEYHAPLGAASQLAVRAGYAFLPSPVPAQTGLTSFVDNDRHVLAVGGGVRIADPTGVLTQPISLDAALQLHVLAPETTLKDPRTFPGEGFTSSGLILAADVAATVRF